MPSLRTNNPMKKRKPLSDEFLASCAEASLIVRTTHDSKGNTYSPAGTLNQAAWLGERTHLLIAEIKRLREELAKK